MSNKCTLGMKLIREACKLDGIFTHGTIANSKRKQRMCKESISKCRRLLTMIEKNVKEITINE